MISHIRGIVVTKQPFIIVIEAAGVGYEITVTQSAFEGAPPIGEEYSVFTRLIIREDAHLLYGFSTSDERRLFDLIISVSGIGPKIGMTILSALGEEAVNNAIVASNTGLLQSIPGVGKKTAERLIVELKDKIGKLEHSLPPVVKGASDTSHIRTEAFAALISLGYTRGDAEKAVRNALLRETDADESVEKLIRASLRNL
jgi:Holliday junction DNA helicase RuvA